MVQREQYAAAKSSRATGEWSPVSSNVNDIIRSSSATVLGRVQQLVRDFPYFKRAVTVLVDYVVGQGIMFQSRVRKPDGHLDTKISQAIEDAFNFWAEQADVSGKLHYYEMMQLAKKQELESGEFMLFETAPRLRNRYLPYALQMYETTWLTDLSTNVSSRAHRIDQGIEYHSVTGEVMAYHFTDPDGWGKTIRVPARHVIHGFETLRPGQLRGISPFAAAVLVAHDVSEYMDTEIDGAKMAAKYLSFVTTPDAFGRQLGAEDDDDGNKIETLENSIIEYLRPGEDVTLASNPRPGDNFSPFMKFLLTMVSITVGAPYELISGDYAGLNYSTSKMIRNDFAHQLKPIAGRHIRQFCQPTIRSFIYRAGLAGKFSVPRRFDIDPYPFYRCEWQPPGMEPVDPQRESKALIGDIKENLRSPQEVVKARGRDLEDIYKEISAAKELAEKYDITWDEATSMALANNPAAIEDQK